MKITNQRLHHSDELEKLEMALQATLVPVTPNPEFVRRLQVELRGAPISPPAISTSLLASEPGKATLIGLAGVFSVLMLAAAGFRTIAAVLGTIGVLSELNKQVKAKKSASLSTAN